MTVPFTETDLRRIAPPRSFERGLGYVDSIADIDVMQGRATATAYGRDVYLVSLTWASGAPDGACTCPHGEEGFFCKHCVALGLRLLRMGDDLTRLVSAAETKRGAIEDWLRSLSQDQLVAELLDAIDDNPRLRRSYELRVASSSGDIGAVRRLVRDLLDFEYGAEDDSVRIADAAHAIQGLIDAGKAPDAIGLSREALELLAGHSDEAVYDLLDNHLLACRASPPDPEDLARYLAALLLRDDYVALPDVEDYADLIGEEGVALIRDEIAAAFASDPGNWMARHLMEDLARAEGDTDTLVAVYAADLDGHGGGYLRIVRELDNAARTEEALSWAERGMRECPVPNSELVDYVADRYASAGRGADVLELRRAGFAAQRSLVNYRALRQAAQAYGDWAAERESALTRLRAGAPSVLIDALIDDGDIEAAWKEAPEIATDAQMLRLADASIDARPADALAVYLKAIAPLYDQIGDPAYLRMAQLLLSARACHEALGTLDAFHHYVSVIRADLKRKRNLMRILDEKGLLYITTVLTARR